MLNDTRIWSAAQMRVSFPHKTPKCVHHLQAEDALKRGCVKCSIGSPAVLLNNFAEYLEISNFCCIFASES